MAKKNIDLQFICRLKDMDSEAYLETERICSDYINRYVQDNDITKHDILPDVIDKVIAALREKHNAGGEAGLRDYFQHHSLPAKQNFLGWLKKICRNGFLDYSKKKSHEIGPDDLGKMMGLDESDHAYLESTSAYEDLVQRANGRRNDVRNNPEWRIAVKEVLAVVDDIKDPRKRVAVILKYLYGMTTQEVADALHVNFDMIQTLLNRTKKAIGKKLTDKKIDRYYLDAEDWRIKHL